MPHVLAGASRKLAQDQIARAGVLGTSFSCNSDFVRQWLAGAGATCVLRRSRLKPIERIDPEYPDHGGATAAAGDLLREIQRSRRARGAVVLACTELPLLLPIPKAGIPLIDCVSLHGRRRYLSLCWEK